MQAAGPATGRFIYRTVRVSDTHEVLFAVDPASEDPIGQFLATSDTISEPPLDAFVALLRPGMRVVDVGAHIGTFALTAAAAGCEVLAVEGARSNVELMEAAARESGTKLHIRHVVASDHDGTASFISKLAWGHIEQPDEDDDSPPPTTMPAATVDSLLRDVGWDRCDFIKIDVEGAENAVLTGAVTALSQRPPPRLLVEINGWGSLRYGISEQEQRKRLGVLGFSLYRVDRRNERRLPVRMSADTEYEAVADYIADASGTLAADLPGWNVAPWTKADELGELMGALSHETYPLRAYAASAASRAPRWLRWRREVRERLRALRSDTNDEVAQAAAWSGRWEPLLHVWWWTQPIREFVRRLR